MEKQLPKNWIKTSIVDFAELVKTKGEENIIPYLEIGDVNTNNKVYELKEKPSVKGCKISKKNDLLISKVRPTRGAITINIHEELYVSSAFTILRFKDIVTSKLVFYQLAYNANFLNYLGDNCTGTMYPTVSEEIIKEYKLIIPPLPEQSRIVYKLNALFAQLEIIKSSVANVPLLLKDFRQQVLESAFKINSKKVELMSVCFKIQDGAHHSPKVTYSSQLMNTFPYITSKNIRNNYMKLDNVQYVDMDFHNTIYPRCTPEFGDVLLTKDGANTGNVTLNELDVPFSLLSSVCLIKTNKEKLIPSYLKYYFQSNVGLSELIGEMTGTAIKRIVLKKIKATKIPLPTIKEQQEIVSRVESLFAKADAIEKQYESLKAKIDNLPQALLHKAFKGELTEQLDSDGDAGELLKEIQELKKETIKSKKK